MCMILFTSIIWYAYNGIEKINLNLKYVLVLFLCTLEKGGILFCNCRSVCRPSVVWSISFDPFTWSIPNLVQGLPTMSRWSQLIFRSHVQRSRSNHSFEQIVYLLNIFWPFHMINTKLGAGFAPMPCTYK